MIYITNLNFERFTMPSGNNFGQIMIFK